MLAFKVTVNGEQVGVCGFEDWAVLSAHVSAGRGDRNEVLDGVRLHVGGLERGSGEGPAHHLRFIGKLLQIGDKVLFEIVDTDDVMTPLKRFRSDHEVQESPFTDEEVERMERETYEELKAKFEPKKRD
ncbi:MAG: hypothetical protein AAF642_02985 [Pseudomonadota bacterium]